MFKIVGNEQNFPEFHQFYELGKQFVPFAQKKLGFDKPVDIELVSDPENAKDPLGKTAYYDPNKMKITLFVDKRHVKDILRSLSHELVHHTQNCRGDFNKGHDLGEGSFSTNKELQKLELEAYAKGNGKVVREFEEQYKKSREVSEMKLDEQQTIHKDETGYVSNLDQEKIDAACSGLKDPKNIRRRKPLGNVGLAEIDGNLNATVPVKSQHHAYQLAQCHESITFRYRGVKPDGSSTVTPDNPEGWEEINSDITIKDSTRGMPDSGLTHGGGEDAHLQESLNHFVDSILDELNYLPKQDILKENNNMSVKEEKGACPGVTCAKAHGSRPCPGTDPQAATVMPIEEVTPIPWKEPSTDPEMPTEDCHKKGCNLADDKGMGYEWPAGSGTWKEDLKCFKSYDCKSGRMFKSGTSGATTTPPAKKKVPSVKEETNENWRFANKDELLFERLVKKWIK